MIRILTIALALLAITILLASSFAVLFPAEESAADGESNSLSQTRLPASARQSGNGARPAIAAPLSATAQDRFAASLKQSPMVAQALENQVTNQLAGYVDLLGESEAKETEIMAALSQAYKDAAALAATKNASNSHSQDPNFVVNAMAEMLEPEELSELELYLENTSKQQFLETVAPQVEIISASLPVELKQQLLDSYFAQHYAATNPHGSLAPQNSADFLKAQLDAIRATRTQLRNSLPEPEFELANQFLNEQEAGLDLGLGLFELNQ